MAGRVPLLPTVLAGLVLAVALECASCGGSGRGAPAELSGVAAVYPLEVDESTVVEALADRVGLLNTLDDHRVEVGYIGGPMCRSDFHRQEPGAVTASYEPERVVVTSDPTTRDCGDADAAEFATAIEIGLEVPLGGRFVTVEVANH
jgi:hypothetical protein